MRDPEALNRWYSEHLGVVTRELRTYEDSGLFQDRGERAFSAVPLDSKLPGPLQKSQYINFGVDDLDGVVEKLRAEGISVEPDPEQ